MASNNLCSSCSNIGCEFQSGIVRIKCAFYMPPQDQYEARLKADTVAVLDKIRAEIEKAVWEDIIVSLDGTDEVRIPCLDPDDVFEIIDKYKIESEE